MDTNQKYYFLIVGIAVLIGCCIYLRYKVKEIKKSLSSTHWTKVIANVDNKSIESSYRGNGFRVYSPKITYYYSVGAAKYTNDVFTMLGTSGFTNKFAKSWVDKFDLGDEIEISYNPKDPKQSVIVPGVHWGQYIDIVFTLSVFLLLALAQVYIFFKT